MHIRGCTYIYRGYPASALRCTCQSQVGLVSPGYTCQSAGRLTNLFFVKFHAGRIPASSGNLPNKEARTGPTQTFVRPDTRTQEMWVKWEMNFGTPHSFPSQLEFVTEETYRDAGQRALSPRKHRL
jgi:hypothetical protein